MKKNKGSGFSLIELLAVIFIISLVFGIGGYYAINTISKSKDRSSDLALANVKTIARYYVEEYPEEIVWKKVDATENRKSCIAISKLIDKGYLKEKDLKNDSLDVTNYVIITKDTSNNIISEEIDTSGTCGEIEKATMVEIPNNKNCNTLIYNGEEQKLVESNNSYYHFLDNQGTDAGAYSVEAKLNEGYTWSDGSKDDKKITCSIKKAIPNLSLNPTPNGMESTKIAKSTTTLKTNVSGTIQVRSSNTDYVTASILGGNNHIDKNGTKDIEIQTLATRKKATYVTITLIPDDSNNYFTGSVIYTIADVSKTKVAIPTASNYCKSLKYNSRQQKLVKTPGTGYLFDNIYGTDVGEYIVTAKLKYGYLWNDGSTEDKTIKCSIKQATPTVTYNSNGGIDCIPKTKIVTYQSNYETLCEPKKVGYTFDGWYTAPSGGTKVTADTTVTKLENHTIYAHWTPRSFTAMLNANGGTVNGKVIDSFFATYDDTYNLATPVRAGHTFKGWYTAEEVGEKVNNPLTWKYTSDQTFIAYWQVQNFNINLNANGGTINNLQFITVSTPYGSIFDSDGYEPIKAGHNFLGWYTNTTGGTEISTLKVTEATTIYAQWEKIPSTTDKVKLTYSSVRKDECNGKEKQYNKGSKYGRLCQPTRAGYKFTGWYTDPKSGTKITKNTKANKDRTVYAHWQFILKSAKPYATNGTWYVWSAPGYVLKKDGNIVVRTETGGPELLTYGSENYNKERSKLLGIENGIVYAYIDDNGNLLKDMPNYYKLLGNDGKKYVKIFIKNDDSFNKDDYGTALTAQSEMVEISNVKYYGVWIAVSCIPDGVTCPANGISLIKS